MQVSVLNWAVNRAAPLVGAGRSASLYTFVALMAVAAVLVSGAPAEAQVSGSRYVTLTEDAPLRCREGDISYAVSTLEKGTVLRVVSENGVWLRAAYPDGLLAVVKSDEVRYDAVSKTVSLLKPSKLRAANESGGERSHWWRLLDSPLPAGTELPVNTVLMRIDGEAEAFMVEAPAGSFGFVRADQARAAREHEIMAFRQRNDPKPTETPSESSIAVASAQPETSEPDPMATPEPVGSPVLTIDPMATKTPVEPAPVLEPEPVRPTSVAMNDSARDRPAVVPPVQAQPSIREYEPAPQTREPVIDPVRPEPSTTTEVVRSEPVIRPVTPSESNAVREIGTERPQVVSAPVDPATETRASVIIDPVPDGVYEEPVVRPSQPAVVVTEMETRTPTPTQVQAQATTRRPEPVRVARPAPRPASVASLTVLFERIQRQPLLEAELEAAIVEFDRTVAHLGSTTEDDAARPLLMRQRDMLQLRADLQRTLRERQGDLTSQTELMQQIESRISRLRDGRSYDLIGRVVPSTVYDGQRLPLMYRVEAYKDGLTRTVGYIRPDRTFDVAPLVGRVAGVRGPAEFDYDLGVAVVVPSTATVLDLNSGAAIVIRDASLEPLSAVEVAP